MRRQPLSIITLAILALFLGISGVRQLIVYDELTWRVGAGILLLSSVGALIFVTMYIRQNSGGDRS